MAYRLEPNKDHQWIFNLLPYQFRILFSIHARKTIEAAEIVQLYGSWHDLMLRGLVRCCGSILCLTAAGKLVCEAAQIPVA